MEHERLSLPLVETVCRSCGGLLPDGHEEDCPLAEHEAMLAGDETAKESHDPDDCFWCLLEKQPVQSQCRCGDCCRRLLIEADVEDARREPRIAERGSPVYMPPEVTRTGRRELVGFMLNAPENDHACAFLDQGTNLCTIYETRPLLCRLFNCDDQENPLAE